MVRMHKIDWYQVGRVLVPRFLAACPHPVTLAGMLIMSNSYLPTSSAWEK
jgi:DNA polymerase gamma 1